MASSGWVLVDDADPRIQYSPGWQAFTNGAEVDGTKHGAASAGLTASLTFTGTQVIVVGSLGSVDVHGVPTSLYTLDGAAAGSYTAPVIAPGFFRLNVTFFSSQALSPGAHTLVITNVNGTSPNVFWLDYVEYLPAAVGSTAASSEQSPPTTSTSQSTTSSSQSQPLGTSSTPAASSSAQAGSSLSTAASRPPISTIDTTAAAPDPTSSQTSSSLPNSNSNAPATSTSHSHAGAIAGGVVGGAALVLSLAVLLFVYLRRRRRRRGVMSTSDPSVRPFGSWRSPNDAQIDSGTPASTSASPPSQKQMQMQMIAMTMAGGSTPTLSAAPTLTPTHTHAGLSPVSTLGAHPHPHPLPSVARNEPQVVQSVDSGFRLAGAVVLPPPYTRE